VIDSRVINALPDLLGSDPSLLAPLRDLMQRGELRRLLQHPHNQPLLMQGRDRLIAELQLTYSNRVADRLQHTLNGILQLPDAQAQPAAAPFEGQPPSTEKMKAQQALARARARVQATKAG